MSLRQATAAALLLTASCGTPAPPPATPVTLSTQNPGDNVAPIVTFFRRTCIEAATEERLLAAAVTASGWPVRDLQGHGPYEPSIWIFDHGRLQWLHSRSMNQCFLSLDSPVAPTPAALGTAFGPVLRRPGFQQRTGSENEAVLTWPAGGDQQMVLTIYVVPPSPGHVRGGDRQPITLQLAREPIPAPGTNQE
jgi:hypothetical protein